MAIRKNDNLVMKLKELAGLDNEYMHLYIDEENEKIVVILHWETDGKIDDSIDLFCDVPIDKEKSLSDDELARYTYEYVCNSNTWLGHIFKNVRRVDNC